MASMDWDATRDGITKSQTAIFDLTEISGLLY